MAYKNYTDSLRFLISAAKKKRIVIDSLIKKRELKHIANITEKTKDNYFIIIINNNDAKSLKSRKNKNLK